MPERYSNNLQDSPTEAEPGRRTPPSGRVWLAKAKALVVDTVPTLNLGRCASTREGNTCVSMKIDVCAIVYNYIYITRISCVMSEVQYRDWVTYMYITCIYLYLYVFMYSFVHLFIYSFIYYLFIYLLLHCIVYVYLYIYICVCVCLRLWNNTCLKGISQCKASIPGMGLGKMDRNLLMCTSVDVWKPAFLNPPGGVLTLLYLINIQVR